LLADEPRTATVTTGSPVDVLRISRGDFRKLLHDSPALALKVLEELAHRLRTTALAV
jgi:CRP-like cAMP-binding protein